MNRPNKVLAVVIIFAFGSCKVEQRLYTGANEVIIASSSSCRGSKLSDEINKEQLKEIVSSSAIKDIKKYRIKTAASQKSSGYAVTKTEVLVTESCNTSDQLPRFSISEKLSITNCKTNEVLIISADTTILQSNTFSSPTVSKQTVDHRTYLESLSRRNYRKLSFVLRKQ